MPASDDGADEAACWAAELLLEDSVLGGREQRSPTGVLPLALSEAAAGRAAMCCACHSNQLLAAPSTEPRGYGRNNNLLQHEAHLIRYPWAVQFEEAAFLIWGLLLAPSAAAAGGFGFCHAMAWLYQPAIWWFD